MKALLRTSYTWIVATVILAIIASISIRHQERTEQSGRHSAMLGLSTTAVFGIVSLAQHFRAGGTLTNASPKATRLMIAAGNDDYNAIQERIADGADPDARDDAGRTALHYALNAGAGNAATVLLQAGADPDAPIEHGMTPLMYAVAANNQKLTNFLLTAGADVNHRADEGLTPLMLAAKNSDPEMVRLLLQAGAKPDARDEQGLSADDYSENNEYVSSADLAE